MDKFACPECGHHNASTPAVIDYLTCELARAVFSDSARGLHRLVPGVVDDAYLYLEEDVIPSLRAALAEAVRESGRQPLPTDPLHSLVSALALTLYEACAAWRPDAHPDEVLKAVAVELEQVQWPALWEQLRQQAVVRLPAPPPQPE